MTISSLLKTACLLTFVSLAPLPAKADDAPLREHLNFDADWRFQKSDPDGTGDSLAYPKLKDALLASTAHFLTPLAAAEPSAHAPADLGKEVTFTQPGFDDADWRPPEFAARLGHRRAVQTGISG